MGLFSKKSKKDEDKKPARNDSKAGGDVAKKADVKVKAEKKKEDKKPVTKKVVKKSDKKTGEAYRFLLRPIISEKATIGAADGKYTFEVSMDSNKVAIKKAIEEVYGVMPTDVNIMNKRGKTVRFGRKHGRTKNIKKAVVTLRKGDSIKLYEGI